MWERPWCRDIAGPARTRDAQVPPTLMPVRMQRGPDAQENLEAIANSLAVVTVESVRPDVERELSANSDVDLVAVRQITHVSERDRVDRKNSPEIDRAENQFVSRLFHAFPTAVNSVAP